MGLIWNKEVIEIVNLGDVTKIKGSEAPLVDIITYGAPCQDISVAGRRAGMKNTIMGDDESTRSGLFFDAIRIVKEMRNESIRQLSDTGADFDIRLVKPRYTVYENVPGCFSSNNGEDFRAVLEETIKVVDENAYVPQLEKGQKWASAGCIVGDGYSVAWRLHDAQFWGVPQRRKRICVLADYGGATAPEILFELVGETDDSETFKAITDFREAPRSEVQAECKGLSGNTEPGEETWQGTAGTSENSLREAIGGGIKTYDVRISSEGTKNQRAHCYETDRSRALDTGGEKPDSNHGGVAVVGCDLYNQTITGETAATLNASSCDSPTRSGPSVIGVDLYNQTTTANVSKTLNAIKSDSDHVPCVIEGNGTRESHRGDGYKQSDVMYTLNAVEQHAVAYGVTAKGNGDAFLSEEKHTSLSTGGGEPGQGYPCVCYGISSYDSNAMKSPNPNSGIYKADTSRTLDNNGGNPACNQGGMAVVECGGGGKNRSHQVKQDFF